MPANPEHPRARGCPKTTDAPKGASPTESGRLGNKLFYGWWIVAAGSFFNLLVYGTFYIGFTAFFDPLRNNLGWSSAKTAAGISIQQLVFAICVPCIGIVFDRLGPRKLALSGMLVAGVGFALMSRTQSPGFYYTTFLIVAFGLGVAWLGPPMYTVSNWFIRKQSRALGILMAGSSLGGFLVPLLVPLISKTGWRVGLMIVGIVYVAVGIPLSVIFRHRPEQFGLLPDGDAPGEPTPDQSKQPASALSSQSSAAPVRGATVFEENFSPKETIRTGAFWLIVVSLMLSQFVMTAVSTLEMPHLENIGISRKYAGIAVTFTYLCSLPGILIGGFLGDILEKRYLLASAIFLQSLRV